LERQAMEAAKARRRRSLAAKRGWQRRKAQAAAPQVAGDAGGSEAG